jgi:manganese/zinc/iron transport system permease protein
MDTLILTPLFGTLFLSIAASLLGVLVYLKKEALLSETLSHSAFLGVVIGFVLSHLLQLPLVYPMAFLIASLSLKMVRHLKKSYTSDSTLCFVLALFFSLAILISSLFQKSYPILIRGANSYLYGSAATICKSDVWVYGALALCCLLLVLICLPILKTCYFDKEYCKSLGISTAKLDKLIEALFILCIVTAIKSVGVVLITAMLITPAIFARLWTRSFGAMFALASFSGAFSCLFGLMLSIEYRVSSGPCIVLVSSAITLISVFVATRGLIVKFYRKAHFRARIVQENILKALFKGNRLDGSVFFSLLTLRLRGLIIFNRGWWSLTQKGRARAMLVIRRHRLWEAYLCFKLNSDPSMVHNSAEQVEHILNEQLEKELDESLDYPTKDPHNQEIFQRPVL